MKVLGTAIRMAHLEKAIFSVTKLRQCGLPRLVSECKDCDHDYVLNPRKRIVLLYCREIVAKWRKSTRLSLELILQQANSETEFAYRK